MVKGEQYNWKHDKQTKLVYLGKDGNWNQFAKIETPDVVWCEVLDNDLRMLEKSNV